MITLFMSEFLSMGFKIAASCNCGYETKFRVGGTRSNFQTVNYFPHYCESCGLVSVNVARPRPQLSTKDKLLSFIGIKEETIEEPLCCPECQSQDIKQYGKKPMTCDDYPEAKIQSFNHFMDTENNFSPSCKQYTMYCDIASFVD
jgi:hypothetical protein